MRRILRRIAISFATVLVLLAGLWFAVPYILGIAINLTCHAPIDQTCQNRMRGLGHLWVDYGNLVAARSWYARAAEAGDAASMFHLAWAWGEAYRGAMMTMSPDTAAANEAAATAATWYGRAAKLGFAPAANNLGEFYAFGIGLPRDVVEAHRLHMLAAEAGNPAGAANAAIDFTMGRGVAADSSEVDRWSEIDPAKASPADLAEPTLGRTLVFGVALDPSTQQKIRLSAEAHVTITLKQSPLTPDPNLPAFRPIATKLKKPFDP